jgi:arylsulfatase A-like enzyme
MKEIILSLIVLTSVLLFKCTPEDVQKRPNIILLMGDDHGWEETAYNGHPYLHTPVLDEMASTGLCLDHFYSAAPTCSPTRGSIITGRHPNRYGTFAPNWSIRPEEISIAKILKNSGYECGHFGKWHLGPVKAGAPTNPGAMGFDTWLSHDNFFEIDPSFSRNGAPPIRFSGESSEILVNETIRFIEQAREKNKPFFAVVWFGSPHEPYSGLKKDLDLYQNLPDTLGHYYVSLTSMETGLQVKRPLDSVLQERFAEITAMDRAIGKLREHLTSIGLRQNTLLWYCGDNGIPTSGLFNTPFRGWKGMVYEGGLRVPGIIEWPDRIPNPRSTNLKTVTSDIFPTLCEFIGEPLPNRPMDGISLLPLIKDNMEGRPNPIFFWNYETSHELASEPEPYIDPELQVGTTPLVKIMDGKYTRNFQNFNHPYITEADFAGPKAVVDNRYKLVIDGQQGNSTKELFDLINDPAEKNNIITTEPEIAEKLEKQLRNWQQSVLESLTGDDYK